MSLDFYNSEESEVIAGIETEGEVSSEGKFTVIWKEFVLPDVIRSPPEDGFIAVLKIA